MVVAVYLVIEAVAGEMAATAVATEVEERAAQEANTVAQAEMEAVTVVMVALVAGAVLMVAPMAAVAVAAGMAVWAVMMAVGALVAAEVLVAAAGEASEVPMVVGPVEGGKAVPTVAAVTVMEAVEGAAAEREALEATAVPEAVIVLMAATAAATAMQIEAPMQNSRSSPGGPCRCAAALA